MSSPVNHLVLLSVQSHPLLLRIQHPLDRGVMCDHLTFLLWGRSRQKGAVGQRNTVFYGLLGIVCFHLKAIKGLPSMETPTAWGCGTSCTWALDGERSLTLCLPAFSILHVSISWLMYALMTCCLRGYNNSCSSRRSRIRQWMQAVYIAITVLSWG